MTGPLRPNPPPPLKLNGRWNIGTLEKKVLNFFSLKMDRPLREDFFLRLPLLCLENSVVYSRFLFWHTFYFDHNEFFSNVFFCENPDILIHKDPEDWDKE